MRFARQEALRLTAAMLGRKFGVQVSFGNIRTAATDGKVIYLPNLATTGSADDMALLYGLVAHEAAHCRFTEFKDRSNQVALVRALENIFEDIRIESALAKVFPGVGRMLFDAAQGLVCRGIITEPLEDKEYEPADILCRMLVTDLRSRHLEQSCFDVIAAQWQAMAKEAFGEDLIAAVMDLADKSKALASTEDANALAWEVYELLETSAEEKEAQKQQQQQQQQEEQEQSEDPSPSSGQADSSDETSQDPAEGEADANGATEPESDSETEDGDPSGDSDSSDQNDDADEDQASESEGAASEDDSTDSEINAIRQAVSSESIESVALEDMLREELGASHVMGAGSRCNTARRCKGVRDSHSVKAYLKRHALKAKLGVRLGRLIEATVEENAWDAYVGRKLSRSAPLKLAQGDLRVFCKREEVPGTHTAVGLLVDYSGSMGMPLGGSSSVSAQDAAYETHFALASVLTTYEVPFMSVAFAEHVCVLKEFDEPLAVHRWNDNASGDTSTGDAMEEALMRMMGREEEKRLLVVVTDGEPNDLEFVVAGCRFARSQGIQVAFVFIGSYGFELEFMLRDQGIASDRAASPEALSQAVFDAVSKAVASA